MGQKNDEDEVVSTSFDLTVECTQEQLAAKVMLEKQEALLQELGLDRWRNTL